MGLTFNQIYLNVLYLKLACFRTWKPPVLGIFV